MSNSKSYVEIMSGPKRLTLLILAAVVILVWMRWDDRSSVNALKEVSAKLGFSFVEKGKRAEMMGVVDGVNVHIKTTAENSGGDLRWFTDFELRDIDQPDGRIMPASMRQSVIDYVAGAESLSTGDEDFDNAVLVAGDLQEMIGLLNSDARLAIKAATEWGWEFNEGMWTVRRSGRMTNPDKIESILDLGIAAANALRSDVEVEEAIRRRAENDPNQGVREIAQGILDQNRTVVTLENADELLNDLYGPSSLDAALLLVREGKSHENIILRISSAVLAKERSEETIPALGKIGGDFEAMMLSTIDDERKELAQKAIAEIEQRLQSEK
jgi:hypothetical protein